MDTLYLMMNKDLVICVLGSLSAVLLFLLWLFIRNRRFNISFQMHLAEYVLGLQQELQGVAATMLKRNDHVADRFDRSVHEIVADRPPASEVDKLAALRSITDRIKQQRKG